jgi:NAD(P)-dependent dehydrogenase (short-subunit alcohol dehydrogenase family)
MSLARKTLFVTGASRGIGLAIALRAARDGANVAIAAKTVKPDPRLPGTIFSAAEEVEKAGGKALPLACDIRDEQSVEKSVAETVARFGGIDILVNNAAYQMAQPGGIEDITTEQFDRVMKTNLYAMFWLSRAAVPHLRPGSSIINTASIQAYQSSPELLDYATTKAGIVAFTKALGAGLAEKGIRVNSVAPGPIWTPLIPATMPDEKVESFGEQTPLGRAGQPAELAPAYVFFASQESSYVTGEVLGVTGGQPLS